MAKQRGTIRSHVVTPHFPCITINRPGKPLIREIARPDGNSAYEIGRLVTKLIREHLEDQPDTVSDATITIELLPEPKP